MCEVADSTTQGNFLQKGATSFFGEKTRDMITPSSTFIAVPARMPVWHQAGIHRVRAEDGATKETRAKAA